ncbi:MAG TPA: TadE/TadG family type IV pilus assembly protein [Gaiellaceae bacterium]|nr:TadE/TadG family type IV pilus assembly protein [Gaiellaceae bacterium]
MSRRSFKNEQGQTMVEFALVLPILLVILFGILQFGVAYNDYVTLTDATRAGARKAAVSRHSGSPEADAEAAVRRSASGMKPCGGGAGLCVTVAGDWQHGGDVTVTARHPYKINLLGLVVASGQLESSTTERVE